MFLCETKLTTRQMQEKSRRLYFEYSFEVERTGKRGGLALIWNSELMVDIKSWSKHHIDAVECAENGSYWRCTGIYGHPETSQKTPYLDTFKKVSQPIISTLIMFWRFQ